VALVEFALVLPLLLVLFLGMLDFGRVINYWADETHLAAEASRFAAVNRNPSSSLSLQEYIHSQLDSCELRGDSSCAGSASVPIPAQVCIDFPNGSSSVGDPVRTTVSVTFHWITFISDKLGDAGGPLPPSNVSVTSTMRLEAVPTNYAAGCYPT
jgi:hypothetical protein